MTGHLLYTEEDRDRAYHAALNAPPCEHWEGDPRQGYATCIGCYVDAALAALSSANRLVPPGSEVREERGFRATPGDPIASAVRRLHIVTPWSPSVPDTEEGK